MDPAEQSGNAYDWALISGGVPRRPAGDGCATGSRLGLLRRFSTNNAGLWLFSRKPVDPVNTQASRQGAGDGVEEGGQAPRACNPPASSTHAQGCIPCSLSLEAGRVVAPRQADPSGASKEPLPPPQPLPLFHHPHHPQSQLMLEKLAELGLTATELVDVQQEGCSYEGAPGQGAQK